MSAISDCLTRGRRGLSSRCRGERGVVLVWVAMLLPVILGLAAFGVDVSYWYFEQRQLQNAADAAALAAAHDLPSSPSTAATDAQAYLSQNVSGAAMASATPYNGDSAAIKVTVSKPGPLFFASVLGIRSPTITASAVARKTQTTISGSSPTTGNDTCGYPASSFNESTVMRWVQTNGTGSRAQVVAYANDENSVLLGVNGATPMVGGTGVSQNGGNGQTGAASYHGANVSGGSPLLTDPAGRPYFPALYITNLTAHPLKGGTGAGDFQNGGTPRNLSGGQPFVDDIFGSWATGTVSSAQYSRTLPPGKNNWNLGVGSDSPVGTTFAAMGNEGYGTEVRWDVAHLTDSDGHALVPSNVYRIQVVEHDGDQNKAGGDAGESCATLGIGDVSLIG